MFVNIRKQPNPADYDNPFLPRYFAAKKGMFSLNENNRIVMARNPCDMRMGVNAMCGRVRMVGLNPAGGDVYVFVGKSRKVMKILH